MDKTQKQIDTLTKENEQLKKQVEELTNNWKRALADYHNLEKRQKEEKEQFFLYFLSDLLKKLLPVFDLLEKAEKHLKDEGLKLALKEFKKILSQIGVTIIEDVGVQFDPHLHEAIEVINGEKDNQVIEIFSKGYLYKNQLIRPAKVKVIRKE